MKKLTILGSTGSIGRSALDVVERYPGQFKVAALAAFKNHGLLLEQIKRFKPDVAALFDPACARKLRENTDIPVFEGPEGLMKAASYEGADFVLSAIVGFAGLAPTLSAIRAGKQIGLANKEVLVTAGDIVMAEAKSRGVQIIPVDSEHSAVFQCIEGRGRESVRRIILTASGGPFAGKSREVLQSIRPEDALRHPNWKMGKKITIDSATLMNKGLEVIEAHYLFGLGPERIDVLIHPQSIVHSMVEFVDGSVMAQLSVPDMKAPIAYALSYPERLPGVIAPLNLAGSEPLAFSEPDIETFPCLHYAYEALDAGGTMPAVLNAANEVAVEAFLEGKIGFNDIPAIIKETMHGQGRMEMREISDVFEADSRSRHSAKAFVDSINTKTRR